MGLTICLRVHKVRVKKNPDVHVFFYRSYVRLRKDNPSFPVELQSYSYQFYLTKNNYMYLLKKCLISLLPAIVEHNLYITYIFEYLYDVPV